MIRTLIFDWDGTLHDTGRLYGCAFRKAYGWLVSGGWAPERDYRDEEVTCYLGMNAPDMWNRFMPRLPQEIKNRASGIIGREMISRVEAGGAVLYPGAEETLNRLKSLGYDMVILSNCKRAYLQAHRRAFSLDRWFSAYYCSGTYQDAPKEVIFECIRKEFPGRHVMIGDRASDIKVGLVHHIPTIACGYGFGNAKEWQGADYVVNSVEELYKILLAVSLAK